jgi:hypothetical protein
MAKTAGTVADLIRRRVYGYTGIAHTQAEVISLLDKTQRVANAFLRKVKSSATLSTLAQKQVYKLRDDLTSAIDVIRITESRSGNDEELFHVDEFAELTAYDQDWFRKIDGTRFDAWTQVGHDLLFIYPAKASGSTVTVYYTKLTNALSAAGDFFELADEDVHVAADLAEIMCLARDKQIMVAKEKIQQLAAYLGLEALK